MVRVTVALAVVISLTVAAPVARAAGGCEVPKHAHVMATARHAVAYRAGSRVFACLESDGDPVLLERVGKQPDGTVTRLRVVLAGTWVAYAKSNSDGFTGYVRIVDFDLHHPNRRHWTFQDGFRRPTVGRLVLAPDGAYAATVRWRVRWSYYTTREFRAVFVVDEVGFRSFGGLRPFDMGSLARSHRVVSWTRDGEPHSRRLRELGKCSLPDEARVRAYRARVVVYTLDERAYACIGRTGERQLINVDERQGRFEDSELFRIGGHFVGWTKYVAREGATDERDVLLYDLDRRRAVREIPVESEECPGEVDVWDVAVARNGDLAWIAVTGDPTDYCSGNPRIPSVNAWDACGGAVLDDDGGIGWTSLRIVGTEVRWEVSGAERSAELRSESDC